jgi:hypothetical protein
MLDPKSGIAGRVEAMKKAMLSIIVLSAFVCLASAGFAAGIDRDNHRLDMERTVLGTITSIDEKKGDINVMDEFKHYNCTVHLRAEDRPKVKVGDRVKIKLQPNTNVAKTIIQENPIQK